MDRTHPDSPGYVESPDWPDDLTALGPPADDTYADFVRAVDERVAATFGVPWEYLKSVDEWTEALDKAAAALDKAAAEGATLDFAEAPIPAGNTLPADSAERKNYPLYRGLMRYFPAALAGVAKHSKEGNDKHNPGQELHHARGKSMDHEDCIMRHLMDLADLEELVATDELLHEADAIAWRALALSQELHEQYGGAPMAPGAEE